MKEEESDEITVVYSSSCSFVCQYFKHIYRLTNDKKERVQMTVTKGKENSDVLLAKFCTMVQHQMAASLSAANTVLSSKATDARHIALT